MRTGRIIAVSPDGAFRRELDAALRAVTDAVEVHAALHALGAGGPPAALCVIHLEGELARTSAELLGPLTGGCPVIAVLPRSDVTAAVALMQASSNVAAVMVAERFDPRQLSAVAARIVADDVFGLAQVMAPETQLHTQLVGDHREKALCMAAVAELVAQAGVPRRHREPIEQCLDEMLMNALYDAPVDEQGQHIFAGVPTNVRVTLRTEHRVAVQYACDGTRFAVAVRDAFGSLERRIVLRHLHKGLHAEQKIDRKAGGAGLGLYLMTHAATAVSFHVLPGISTEALCVFELEAPRRQLEQLAFLVQRDAAGQVPSGPARRLPAGPRRRGRVVAAALAALAGLAGVLVLARSLGGADEARAPATVELDSQPTGAAVEIDGQAIGSTPLTLTSLAPGATVSIVFKRTGYRAATAQLQVPAPGAAARHVQPLEQSDELVRVRFVSKPPGAEVIRTGQATSIDRTYTPAEVFVEAGKEQRFTLTMPKHVPLVIEPFTPARGARGLEKGGDLASGAPLRLEAPRGGTATVSGAPHCREVALPFDCTLAPGTYVVEYRGPGGAAAQRTVKMGAEDAVETFGSPPPKKK